MKKRHPDADRLDDFGTTLVLLYQTHSLIIEIWKSIKFQPYKFSLDYSIKLELETPVFPKRNENYSFQLWWTLEYLLGVVHKFRHQYGERWGVSKNKCHKKNASSGVTKRHTFCEENTSYPCRSKRTQTWNKINIKDHFKAHHQNMTL